MTWVVSLVLTSFSLIAVVDVTAPICVEFVERRERLKTWRGKV
jgi:hypothetical protein